MNSANQHPKEEQQGKKKRMNKDPMPSDDKPVEIVLHHDPNTQDNHHPDNDDDDDEEEFYATPADSKKQTDEDKALTLENPETTDDRILTQEEDEQTDQKEKGPQRLEDHDDESSKEENKDKGHDKDKPMEDVQDELSKEMVEKEEVEEKEEEKEEESTNDVPTKKKAGSKADAALEQTTSSDAKASRSRGRQTKLAKDKGATKTETKEISDKAPNDAQSARSKKKDPTLIPRPRGRPKEGHVWDGVKGTWVPKESSEDGEEASRTNKDKSETKARRTKRPSLTTSDSKPAAAATTTTAAAATTTTPHAKRAKRGSMATPSSLEALPSPNTKSMRDQVVSIAREDLWNTDENVIIAALVKLSEMCEPDDMAGESCRQFIFESGVHTLVVKLLEQHMESKELQEKGLEVLFRVSASPRPIIEEALLSMGSVEVALKAMLKYPEEVEIQVFACVLLGNLTNTAGGWDAIQQSAVKVQALNENTSEDKDGIQKDEASGEAAKTSQLLAAVQTAQQRHADNEKMQEAAAFFLDRSLSIAGKPVLDLLITTAPCCMHSLLLAKQMYGSYNPSLSRKVISFFKEVSKLC